MHKIFGTKKDVDYMDREGAYLIPIKNNSIGVVKTPKGYFLLGGGLDNDETNEMCLERECLEEAGYTISIKYKIASAETYYKAPKIGYFHPVQAYYAGELLKKVCVPVESDHKFVWVKFNDLKGKMYLEMQNWAIEQSWSRKNKK